MWYLYVFNFHIKVNIKIEDDVRLPNILPSTEVFPLDFNNVKKPPKNLGLI